MLRVQQYNNNLHMYVCMCGYVLMRACVRASYHLVFILECENNRTNLSLLLLLQKKCRF